MNGKKAISQKINIPELELKFALLNIFFLEEYKINVQAISKQTAPPTILLAVYRNGTEWSDTAFIIRNTLLKKSSNEFTNIACAGPDEGINVPVTE